eukprot:m.915403 g.915403  ORF g.915403 m.915403 type:complete len:4105 (+) comp60152_c0_seq1:3-12317(+)
MRGLLPTVFTPAVLESIEAKFDVIGLLTRDPVRFELIKDVVREFQRAQATIAGIDPHPRIGPVEVSLVVLRHSLLAQIANKKLRVIGPIHQRGRQKLDRLNTFMTGAADLLSKPVKSLRELAEMRKTLDAIDSHNIGSHNVEEIEQFYHILAGCDVHVSAAELASVSTLAERCADFLLETPKLYRQLMTDQRIEFEQLLDTQEKSLLVAVIHLRDDFDERGPLAQEITPHEASARLKEIESTLALLKEEETVFLTIQAMFGRPTHPSREIESLDHDVRELKRLYSAFEDFVGFNETLRSTEWRTIDLGLMEDNVESRLHKLKFMPASLQRIPAFIEMNKTLGAYSECLGLLLLLASPTIRERHWREVMLAVGRPFRLESMLMSVLLDLDLPKFRDKIVDLTTAAESEARLEAILNDTESQWNEAMVTFDIQGDSDFEIFLLVENTRSLIRNAESSRTLLLSQLSAPLLGVHRMEVVTWINKLTEIAEFLELWVKVQALWVQLQRILTVNEQHELFAERQQFSVVNDAYVRFMRQAQEFGNLIHLLYGNGDSSKRATLQNVLSSLESCRYSLSAIFQEKRSQFPRLHLLTDEIFLQLLTEPIPRQSVAPTWLPLMFPNIVKLSVSAPTPARAGGLDPMAHPSSAGRAKPAAEEPSQITGFVAVEGEALRLDCPFPVNQNVCEWVEELVSEIRATLKARLFDGVELALALPPSATRVSTAAADAQSPNKGRMSRTGQSSGSLPPTQARMAEGPSFATVSEDAPLTDLYTSSDTQPSSLAERPKAPGRSSQESAGKSTSKQPSMSSLQGEPGPDVKAPPASSLIDISTKDLLNLPTQVAVLLLRWLWTRHWTHNISNTRDSKHITSSLAFLKDHLNGCSSLIVKGDSAQTLGISRRVKLETLLTVLLHLRECSEDLVQTKCRDLSEFSWLKHPRIELADLEPSSKSIEASVLAIDVSLPYGFEYVGSLRSAFYAVTPMTDRAFVYFLQMLQQRPVNAVSSPFMNRNQAFAESASCMLGWVHFSLPCFELTTAPQMATFMRVALQPYTWSSFVNFQLLSLEVVAVLTQSILQFLPQHHALAAESKSTSPGSLFALTALIPFSKGHSGPTLRLPADLRAQLRITYLETPPLEQHLRFLFVSRGYYRAPEALARRVALFLETCRSTISESIFSHHSVTAFFQRTTWDRFTQSDRSNLVGRWRRRFNTAATLLSSGQAAGDSDSLLAPQSPSRRRGPGKLPASAQPMESSQTAVLLDEAFVIRQLIKFYGSVVGSDQQLQFIAIVRNLFGSSVDQGDPAIDEVRTFNSHGLVNECVEDAARRDFERALQESVADTHLSLTTELLATATHLYLNVLQSTSVIVHGPAYSGKTTLVNLVAGALSHLTPACPVFVHHLICDALSESEFFGGPTASHQGALEYVLARAQAMGDLAEIWLVLDGLCNPAWTASLIQMINDCTIRSGSGASLPLPANIRFIFEVQSDWTMVRQLQALDFAVITSVSQTMVDSNCLLQTWLASRRAGENVALAPLLEKYLPCLVSFQQTQPPSSPERSILALTRTFIKLLESMLTEAIPYGELTLRQSLEKFVIFASTWSFGALLTGDGRMRFHNMLRGLSSLVPEDLAGSKLVFDFFLPDCMDWTSWETAIRDVMRSGTEDFVVHKDSLRTEYLMRLVLRSGGHAMLLGPRTAGKTANVKKILAKPALKIAADRLISYACGHYSEGNTLQRLILQTIHDVLDADVDEKAQSQQVTVFVDNIELATRSLDSRVSSIEFLRSLIQHGKVFDILKPASSSSMGNWSWFPDTSLVATIDTGDVHSAELVRLSQHAAVFLLSAPTTEEMTQLATWLVEGILESKRIQQDEEDGVFYISLIESTVRVYSAITARLLPTTEGCWFYDFSLREIFAVLSSLRSLPVPSSPSVILGFWKHEVTRVFADRIESATDRQWVLDTIVSILRQHPAVHDEPRKPSLFEEFTAHLSSMHFGLSDFFRACTRSIVRKVVSVDEFDKALVAINLPMSEAARAQLIAEITPRGKSEITLKNLFACQQAAQAKATPEPGSNASDSVVPDGAAPMETAPSKRTAAIRAQPRVEEESDNPLAAALNPYRGTIALASLPPLFLHRPPESDKDTTVVASKDKAGASWAGSCEPLAFLSQLSTKYEKELAVFNKKHREKQQGFIATENSLLNLVRLMRVLSRPGGHALFVGLPGSGGTTSTRLAAALLGYEVTAVSTDSLVSFSADMRNVYRLAGAKNEKFVVLLDGDGLPDFVLDRINTFVTFGKMNDLFTKNELAAIFSSSGSTPAVKKDAQDLAAMSSDFFSRVSKNIHIVMSFSSYTDESLGRVQMTFPSLVGACFLARLEDSQPSVMADMAVAFLASNSVLSAYSVTTYTSAANCLAEIFGIAQSNASNPSLVSPAVFMVLLECVRRAIKFKLMRRDEEFERLRTAVDGCNAIKAKVDALQARADLLAETLRTLEDQSQATFLQLALAAATFVNSRPYGFIDTTQSASSSHVDMLLKRSRIKSAIASKQTALQKKRAELETARVELLDSQSALTPSIVDGVRALINPPEIITSVAEMLSLVLHKPVISWAAREAMQSKAAAVDGSRRRGARSSHAEMWGGYQANLASSSLPELLMSFNSDSLNGETAELMQGIVLAQELQSSTVRRASRDAEVLFNWMQALVHYKRLILQPDLAEDVAAEEAALKRVMKGAASASLLTTTGAATEAEEANEEAPDDDPQAAAAEAMMKLQQEYDVIMMDSEAARVERESLLRLILRFQALQEGLEAKAKAWREDLVLANSGDNLSVLLANCIISSAFVTYCPPFSELQRELCKRLFVTAALTHVLPDGAATIPKLVFGGVSLNDYLISNSHFQSVDISTDSLSLSSDNSIILGASFNTTFFVVIDPYQTAASWLQQAESDAGLKIISHEDALYDAKINAVLKECLLKRHSLLITEIDAARLWQHASMRAIISRSTTSNARMTACVRIGEEDVPYFAFRMYLSATSVPTIPQLMMPHVTLVDAYPTRSEIERHLMNCFSRIWFPNDQILTKQLLQSEKEQVSQRALIELSLIGSLAEIAKDADEGVRDPHAETLAALTKTLELIQNLDSVDLTLGPLEENIALLNKRRDDLGMQVVQATSGIYAIIMEMRHLRSAYQLLGFADDIFSDILSSFCARLTDSIPLEPFMKQFVTQIMAWIYPSLYAQDRALFASAVTVRIGVDKGMLAPETILFFNMQVSRRLLPKTAPIKVPKPRAQPAVPVGMGTLRRFSGQLSLVDLSSRAEIRLQLAPTPAPPPAPQVVVLTPGAELGEYPDWSTMFIGSAAFASNPWMKPLETCMDELLRLKQEFQSWRDNSQPDEASLPARLEESLTPTQVLFIRVLAKPERMMACLKPVSLAVFEPATSALFFDETVEVSIMDRTSAQAPLLLVSDESMAICCVVANLQPVAQQFAAEIKPVPLVIKSDLQRMVDFVDSNSQLPVWVVVQNTVRLSVRHQLAKLRSDSQSESHANFRLIIMMTHSETASLELASRCAFRILCPSSKSLNEELAREMFILPRYLADAHKRPDWLPLLHNLLFIDTIVRKQHGSFIDGCKELEDLLIFARDWAIPASADLPIRFGSIKQYLELTYGGRMATFAGARILAVLADTFLAAHTTRPGYLFFPGQNRRFKLPGGIFKLRPPPGSKIPDLLALAHFLQRDEEVNQAFDEYARTAKFTTLSFASDSVGLERLRLIMGSLCAHFAELFDPASSILRTENLKFTKDKEKQAKIARLMIPLGRDRGGGNPAGTRQHGRTAQGEAASMPFAFGHSPRGAAQKKGASVRSKEVQPAMKPLPRGLGVAKPRELLEFLRSALPSPASTERSLTKLQALRAAVSPVWAVFFASEYHVLQTFLTMVQGTLTHLELAIAREALVTRDLTQFAHTLGSNRIPDLWKAVYVTPDDMSLGSFVDRLKALNDDWERVITNGTKLSSFCLSWFSNPVGFLSAVELSAMSLSQTKELILQAEITARDPDMVREPPAEGMFVHGLVLLGALLEGTEVRELNSAFKAMLPIVHVRFSAREKPSADQAAAELARSRRFSCPCYRTVASEEPLFFIQMLLNETMHATHVELRGVRIILA